MYKIGERLLVVVDAVIVDRSLDGSRVELEFGLSNGRRAVWCNDGIYTEALIRECSVADKIANVEKIINDRKNLRGTMPEDEFALIVIEITAMRIALNLVKKELGL